MPEALRRAGERAAGIAHDLRNALTLAQLALGREEAAAARSMPATRSALEEARALCVRFLAGLVGGQASWTEVRLRDLLERELQAASWLEPNGVAILLRCPRRLTAWTDPAALGRVVRNLTSNAVRASGPGGIVRVRAGRVGSEVSIVVDDRGRGMDAAQLAAAMRPAASTRGPGGGYGSVSLLDCVRELGARLVVRSASGVGTRCRLWIPAPAAEVSGGSWRVDPDSEGDLSRTPKTLFRDVAAFERALREARPREVLACRTLPGRDLMHLRALCAQASVVLTVEGLRRPG